MSVGAAIFLSALLLSVVGLYAATKDRWNWKRIAKWAFAAPIALALVLWGSSWVYFKFQERPALQTEFEGLRLGATESDVLFLKGKPYAVHESSKEQWAYFANSDSAQSERAFLIISFRDGKVRCIRYTETTTEGHRPRLLGFTIGSKYEDIVERLGKPSNVSTSKDDLSRVASFAEYNAFFEFEKGRVTEYGIFDNKTGPIRLSNEAGQASSAPK
jgi:hypothetical protein